ncbi:MAG: peptidase S8 and S53, subtilisin, kexin, sedolisin, partial [Candidatus Eremiobacteraeota bacterium]|nr:peptidase S8 and S53, subtilisin, kexin, sedolisin [Candidatus Eremiobacteraeota bacterium]
KPDVVTYGGCPADQFTMLAPGAPTHTREDWGTSFAAPLAMRTALGIAAFFGYEVRPLAVKALLISNARQAGHPINEVGWGQITDDYLDVVTCEGSEVQIIYQGVLRPGKSLRAEVPLPMKMTGNSRVKLSSTICYGCEIEPQNPATYTRAGLEVVFRPHSLLRKTATQLHADSAPFFQVADFKATEASLRIDAHKWETTLKKARSFAVDSLHEPTFDIHYIAREGGANPTSPAEIPYAMVVRVEQSDMATLYDEVVARYRNRLEILRPQVAIPVRIYTRQP